MTVCDPQRGIVHGYVVVIGPETNPNYFTGSAWSAHLDDARVYRRAGDAKGVTTRRNTAKPVPAVWWSQRRTIPVSLKIEGPML